MDNKNALDLVVTLINAALAALNVINDNTDPSDND